MTLAPLDRVTSRSTGPVADPQVRTARITVGMAADTAGSTRYRLAAGITVVERQNGSVLQLGAFAPRQVQFAAEPALVDWFQQLARQAQLTPDPGLALPAELHSWAEPIEQLQHRGFLVDAALPLPAEGTRPEEAAITQRFGAQAVPVVRDRRADAVVEVRGSGLVATTLSVVLATAGIGHVLPTPTRQVLVTDLLPPPAGPVGDSSRVLAERISAVSRRIAHHRFAGHLVPSLVVLADDGPPTASQTAELHLERLPHLAVWAGPARAVVGPLVIPGVTSCLLCAELTRTDRDPEWLAIRDALRRAATPPTAAFAVAAAAHAAADALALIDELECPQSVDGTIEWTGTGLPRRRSWTRHPECGCHRKSPPGGAGH